MCTCEFSVHVILKNTTYKIMIENVIKKRLYVSTMNHNMLLAIASH